MALDIAPDYAGSVVGVGNTVGNVSAIIATNLVLVTHNPMVSSVPLCRVIELSLDQAFLPELDIVLQNLQGGWNVAFLATAGLNFAGAIFFALLGTAQEESWSKEGATKGEKRDGGKEIGRDSRKGSLSALFTASIH